MLVLWPTHCSLFVVGLESHWPCLGHMSIPEPITEAGGGVECPHWPEPGLQPTPPALLKGAGWGANWPPMVLIPVIHTPL